MRKIRNGERVRNLLRDREALDKRSASVKVLALYGVSPILHHSVFGFQRGTLWRVRFTDGEAVCKHRQRASSESAVNTL
jgi:hypothetical protein